MQHNGHPGELNPFARFWVDVWRCLRRVFSCNFQTTRVTAREARKLSLSSSPITEPVGQSYAAWRRSALWIASIAFLVHVVIQLSTFRFMSYQLRREAEKSAPKLVDEQVKAAKAAIDSDPRAAMQLRVTQPELYAVATGQSSKSRYTKEFAKKSGDAQVKAIGESNLSMLDGFAIVVLVVAVISSVIVLMSAIFWSNLVLSRRLAFVGWGILFATPLFLAMLPMAKLMDFSHVTNPTARKTVVLLVGAVFALQVFVTEGAKVLAVFPGVIRSSIGLKTLLPESAAPGWIVALIAPIYMMVLLLFFIIAIQLQGSPMLVIAALLLMAAPSIYLVFHKAVVRPHDAKEIGSRIIPVRLAVVTVNAIGLILLSIWVIRQPFFTVGDVFKFVFGLIANVLLLTVVVTDIVIRTLRAGYIQTQGLQESRLREKLDYRFAALAQIGRRQNAPVADIPGRAAGKPVFDDPTPSPFGRKSSGVDDSLVFEEPVFEDRPKRNDDGLVLD